MRPRLIFFLAALLLPAAQAHPQGEAPPEQHGAHDPQQAHGGLLLVITAVIPAQTAQDPPEAWWMGARPALTPTDARLIAALRDASVPVIDPSALSNPPALSQRVFGRPDLTPANAQNLASLFGATLLLHGTSRCEPLPPSPYLRGQSGARFTLAASLTSTQSPQTPRALHLEEAAFAQNPDEACNQALSRVAARLCASLPTPKTPQTPVWGGDEPLIILSGLDRAEPLVQIKKHLRTHPEVQDVLERWAAEGHLALDINPHTQDPPASIQALAQSLASASFPGFSLSLTAEGRDLSLRVTPSAASE